MSFYNAESRDSEPSIAGKISVGIPVDEPAIVNEDLVGCKLRSGVQKAGLRTGYVLKKKDIKKLKKVGIEEVEVFRGRAPERLDYFRLLRRSNEFQGSFVADPSLNEKHNLGKEPQQIPIIFPVNDIDQVFQNGMRNYYPKEGKMFCSSDGKVAKRAVIKNKQFTGRYKKMECIPFYGMDRGSICPFRDHGTKQHKQMPCQFNSRLYFNILSDELDSINIGRFFKLQTSSRKSAQYFHNSLKKIKERYNTIAWIPCKLHIQFEKTTTPDGIDTEVPRLSLSTSMSLMKRYRGIISEVKDLIEVYSIPTSIDEKINDEELDSEFRPDVRVEQLRREGVIDEESDEEGHELSIAEDPEFDVKLNELDAKCRQLSPDAFEEYQSKRNRVNTNNIDKFLKRINKKLFSFSEEEKERNFEQNALPE